MNRLNITALLHESRARCFFFYCSFIHWYGIWIKSIAPLLLCVGQDCGQRKFDFAQGVWWRPKVRITSAWWKCHLFLKLCDGLLLNVDPLFSLNANEQLGFRLWFISFNWAQLCFIALIIYLKGWCFPHFHLLSNRWSESWVATNLPSFIRLSFCVCLFFL